MRGIACASLYFFSEDFLEKLESKAERWSNLLKFCKKQMCLVLEELLKKDHLTSDKVEKVKAFILPLMEKAAKPNRTYFEDDQAKLEIFRDMVKDLGIEHAGRKQALGDEKAVEEEKKFCVTSEEARTIFMTALSLIKDPSEVKIEGEVEKIVEKYKKFSNTEDQLWKPSLELKKPLFSPLYAGKNPLYGGNPDISSDELSYDSSSE